MMGFYNACHQADSDYSNDTLLCLIGGRALEVGQTLLALANLGS